MAKAAAKKMPSVFIDGEAGTTGLEIRERLAKFGAVQVRSIDPAKRKDATARQALMAEVDIVILCLPDDAALEAVALADALGARSPRIIDASTAHRVDPKWVYGFPEMAPGYADKIANAKHVSNPGCYPTGGIALIRPLVDAGLMPKDFPLTISAVSGYSGGGKTMIEAHEAGTAPAFDLYGLGLMHKHVPELQRYTGLTRRPIFIPSVGTYRKGMLVTVPLHLEQLPGKPKVADLRAALSKHYAGAKLVKVLGDDDAVAKSGRMEPEGLNGTDMLELRVFGSDAVRQAVLVAKLDNLGKGAAGAAVQSMGLMLGV
jgi:N-acetyl-gamma-glutamyl-phosphate reductase